MSDYRQLYQSMVRAATYAEQLASQAAGMADSAATILRNVMKECEEIPWEIVEKSEEEDETLVLHIFSNGPNRPNREDASNQEDAFDREDDRE